MDFIPDKEFHAIFDRVSRTINLKGAYTPDEVHRRLRRVRRHYKEQEAEFKDRDRRPPKSLVKKRRNIENLIVSDFGQRVASEAFWNPDGIIGLTLKYGRAKAREVLLRRHRRRLGELRRVKLERRRF